MDMVTELWRGVLERQWVVCCHPNVESTVRTALDAAKLPGLWSIRTNTWLDEDKFYVVDAAASALPLDAR
jgi:hypothetical protein